MSRFPYALPVAFAATALPSLNVALLLLSMPGCSNSEGENDQAVTGAGGSTPGAGGNSGETASFEYARCSAEEAVGNFQVQLIEDAVNITGRVSDAVTPANIQEVVRTEGECRLLRGRVLFCDPACSGGQICGESGTCQAAPVNQDVGTISVEGFEAPIELRRSAGSGTYSSVGTLPPLAEGAAVRLASTGGVYEPLVLDGQGVPAIDGADDLQVAADAALPVTWNQPEMVLQARVQINLNINNHGTTPAQIECETADDGDFEVPAGLITELTGFGLSGFPTLVLTRQTVDAAEIAPGCVELRVLSTQSLAIEVEGVVSCNDDTDCPEGVPCDPTLLACRAE